jgi:hypothetical protein
VSAINALVPTASASDMVEMIGLLRVVGLMGVVSPYLFLGWQIALARQRAYGSHSCFNAPLAPAHGDVRLAIGLTMGGFEEAGAGGVGNAAGRGARLTLAGPQRPSDDFPSMIAIMSPAPHIPAD